MVDAACANTSADLFFPKRGKNTNAAKRLCAKCPVRTECSSYAERTGSVGMWAGESRRLGTETSETNVTGEASSEGLDRPFDDVQQLRSGDVP